MSAAAIIQAYRWQRGLGHQIINAPLARLVTSLAFPEVWDANHADGVTAESPEEIEAVFGSMDRHLGHTRWRVVHTDPTTPEPFLARLALDGFEEKPAVIQMRLEGEVSAEAKAPLKAVACDEDWARLSELVRLDHEEGARTARAALSAEVTGGIVASYRAKAGPCRFHTAWVDGEPVAYGAMALAPSGAGMIEDLFTLPSHRRRGIASGMIASFAQALRSEGCSCVFLGALAGENARLLYAKLGFRPLMLTRCWVRQADPVS